MSHRICGTGLVLVALLARVASGQVVLDQSNPWQGSWVGNGGSFALVQQEISVGTTGTLHGLRIWFEYLPGFPDRPEAMMNLEFFRGSPWQTGEGVGAVELSLASGTGVTAYDLDLRDLEIAVSAGESLTLSIDSLIVGRVGQFGVTREDAYPGGGLWFDGSPWSQADADLAFELFVAVPSPAGAVPLAMALGLATRRRR